MKVSKHAAVLMAGTILFTVAVAAPVDTQISYQGSLLESGVPASGSYDLTLQLWDGPDTGSGAPLGEAIVFDDVQVADGVFTVYPDFGVTAFDGGARWLEIGVRDGASTGAYTLLSPFQPLTPAPQSRYAVNAGLLDGFGAGNFAAAGHGHAMLTPGTGLTGSEYDGTTARTIAVKFGTDSGDAAPGDAPMTITAGNGLSGGGWLQASSSW